MKDVLEFIEQNGREFYNLAGDEQDENDEGQTIMLEIMVTPFLFRKLKEMAGSDDMDEIADLIVEIINDRIL